MKHNRKHQKRWPNAVLIRLDAIRMQVWCETKLLGWEGGRGKVKEMGFAFFGTYLLLLHTFPFPLSPRLVILRSSCLT